MYVLCMGIARQEPLVRSDKSSKRILVVFDNGARRSLIRGDVAYEICTPRKLLVPRVFVATNGKKVSCWYVCDIAVEIGGREVGVEAFLVDSLLVPMIFGALDMEAYRIKIDLAGKFLDLSEFTGTMLAL